MKSKKCDTWFGFKSGQAVWVAKVDERSDFPSSQVRPAVICRATKENVPTGFIPVYYLDLGQNRTYGFVNVPAENIYPFKQAE